MNETNAKFGMGQFQLCNCRTTDRLRGFGTMANRIININKKEDFTIFKSRPAHKVNAFPKMKQRFDVETKNISIDVKEMSNNRPMTSPPKLDASHSTIEPEVFSISSYLEPEEFGFDDSQHQNFNLDFTSLKASISIDKPDTHQRRVIASEMYNNPFFHPIALPPSMTEVAPTRNVKFVQTLNKDEEEVAGGVSVPQNKKRDNNAFFGMEAGAELICDEKEDEVVDERTEESIPESVNDESK